jgi:hypothetical protein
MTDAAIKPLAGRQWRSTKKAQTGGGSSQVPPPAATRSSALPRRASADSERELAKRIADRYITRTGKILISGGKHG